MSHHKNTTLSQRSSSTLNEQLKGLVNQAISLSYRRQELNTQLNKINVILEMLYRLIFSDSGILMDCRLIKEKENYAIIMMNA